jgi:hypothetical protein
MNRPCKLGADKAQPGLQPRPRDAVGWCEIRGRKAVRHVLEDRRFGEHCAVVGAQRRNVADRVDGEIVAAVEDALCFGIDLDEARVGPGFVNRNPRGHRTGEGSEIQVHGDLLLG